MARITFKFGSWGSILTMIVMLASSAVSALPTSGVSYQGRILKPDGQPLSGQFAQFKMQIRTPNANNCLLFEELQTLDMRSSNGSFAITMNDGSGTRTDSSGFGFDRIFNNRGTYTFDPLTCSAGSDYTPSSGDGRRLVVLFKDETMATWEPIPSVNVNYVPFAFESKYVAGFGVDSMVRVVDGSGNPATGLAPLSNAEYTKLLSLIAGSSSDYERAGRLGGVSIPATSSLSAGQVLTWNGSTWIASTPGGAGSVSTSSLADGAVTAVKLAPAVGSSGQLLSVDGSGNLVWSNAPSNSQWTTQSPGINYTGGRVGIGTTSAATTLAVSAADGVYSGANIPVGPLLVTNTSNNFDTLGLLPAFSLSRPGKSGSSFGNTANFEIGRYATATSAPYTQLALKLNSTNSVPDMTSMVWSSNGRVGVGTTLPSDKFDVRGAPYSSNIAFGVQIGTTNGEWLSRFAMKSDSGGYVRTALETSDGGTTGATRESLTIDRLGLVGIGTTAPLAQLNLGGSVSKPAWGALGSGLRIDAGTFNDTTSSGALTSVNAHAIGEPTLSFSNTSSVTNAATFAIAPLKPGTNATVTNSSAVSIQTGVLTGVTNGYGLRVDAPTGATRNFAANLNGNVAIGDADPTYAGQVGVNSNVNLLAISGKGSESSTSSGRISLSNNRPTPTAGDQLGGILFNSVGNGSSSTYWNTSQINSYLYGSGGSNGFGSYINFLVKGDNGNVNERMRLMGNGRVGIGTTSPDAVLHIKAGAASAAPLKLTSSGSGVLLTTPQDGAVEYDGTALWFTIGATRYVVGTNTASGNYSNVTNISNSGGSIVMGPASGSGAVQINSGTSSLNSTSGALIVTGGAGISQNLNVGGNVYSSGTLTSVGSAYLPQIFGGTAASSSVRIDGADNAVKGPVVLNATGGNVGIGTTSPNAKFEVHAGDASTVGDLLVDTVNRAVYIGRQTPTVGEHTRFIVRNRVGTAYLTVDPGSERTYFGPVSTSATVGIGTSTPTAGVGLDISNGLNAVVLGADNNALSRTNAGAKIARVGIHPFNNSDFPTAVYVGRTSAAGDGDISFGGSTSTMLAATSLRFYTGAPSTATGTERVVINSSGNVGIGSTSPSEKLEVRGNLLVTAGNVPLVDQSSTAITAYPQLRITANNAVGIAGLNIFPTIGIDSGVSSTGAYRGANIYALRNHLTSLTDSGSITTVNGAAISYGHNAAVAGATPQTTNAYGLHISPFIRKGTIDNMYDLFIGATSTGGAVTNTHYGVYQMDAGVTNYFAGNVGIGTTSPLYKLDVAGDLRITGTPYRDGGDVAWTVPSDARLKDVTASYDRGLQEISQLKMIKFRYKPGNAKGISSDTEYTGVIAQNVQQQIPEAVKVDRDGYLSLNTTPIFWAMINAIKDLYVQVRGTKTELASLKAGAASQANEIETLRFENARLKKEVSDQTKSLGAMKSWICQQDRKATICD